MSLMENKLDLLQIILFKIYSNPPFQHSLVYIYLYLYSLSKNHHKFKPLGLPIKFLYNFSKLRFLLTYTLNVHSEFSLYQD